MMGLTSGWDTRVLLAVSKEKKSFVDHKVSVKLAEYFDLNHIIFTFSKNKMTVAEQLAKNLPHFSLDRSAFQVSHAFPGVLSISGNYSEIVRNFFPDTGKVNGKLISKSSCDRLL